MREDSGKPAIGSSSGTLGIRFPDPARPDVEPDIRLDAARMVHPGPAGMSVSPSIRDLPARMIPKRLKPLYPQARGNNNLVIWAMGSGPFEEADLTDSLRVRLDPDDPLHGFVAPASTMSAVEYERAIHETQGAWSIDEGGTP